MVFGWRLVWPNSIPSSYLSYALNQRSFEKWLLSEEAHLQYRELLKIPWLEKGFAD